MDSRERPPPLPDVEVSGRELSSGDCISCRSSSSSSMSLTDWTERREGGREVGR